MLKKERIRASPTNSEPTVLDFLAKLIESDVQRLESSPLCVAAHSLLCSRALTIDAVGQLRKDLIPEQG